MFRYSKFYILLYSLALLLYVTFCFYCSRAGYIFNQYNREFSVIILLLFSIGAIVALHSLITLNREVSTSERLARTIPRSKEEAVGIPNQLPRTLVRSLLEAVVTISERGSQVNYERLEAIVYQKLRGPASFAGFLAGAVLLIGLMGTLLGIIETVAGYRSTLEHASFVPSDFHKILAGTDQAFGTTIVGIASSLVLSFAVALHTVAERRLRAALSLLVLGNFLPYFVSSPSDLFAMAVERSLVKALPSLVTETSERLVSAISRLEASTHEVHQFAEGMRELSDSLSENLKNLHRSQESVATILSSISGVAEEISRTEKKHNAMTMSISIVSRQLLDELKLVRQSITSDSSTRDAIKLFVEKLPQALSSELDKSQARTLQNAMLDAVLIELRTLSALGARLASSNAVQAARLDEELVRIRHTMTDILSSTASFHRPVDFADTSLQSLPMGVGIRDSAEGLLRRLLLRLRGGR